jgi:hypothetical protein
MWKKHVGNRGHFLCEPGLPAFSSSKHTKLGKIYQMNTDYTKRPKIILTAVTYS